MTDIIVVAILVVVLGSAIGYIIKAKKSGRKCIGCPESCCPSNGQSGSCGCSCGK